jgi:hypothetical protein
VYSWIERDSPELSVAGSRVADWSWRETMKPDDNLDILDQQGIWFLGTILRKESPTKIKIGYRIYYPEGTKSDEKGRFEGWTSKYDETFSIYSILLQRSNSITKKGTVYCRKELDNEGSIPDDSVDILLNYPLKDKMIYVVHRPNKNYSMLCLSLLSDFANGKGFDRIIEYLKANLKNVSVEEVFDYLDFMATPGDLYHKKYVNSSIVPFINCVLNYLSDIPEKYLSIIRRENLENALVQLDLLMRRVYTAKTKGENFITVKVGIIISLLKSEILEHRIQAIRLLADTCRTAKKGYRTNGPTANDNTVLKNLLKVPRLIEEIFGKRGHIELIHRSTEILNFFLLSKTIDKEQFNIIWERCEQDEQSKIEILKVISDAANYLHSELLELIAEKYEAKSKKSFIDQEIELLYKLSSNEVATKRFLIEKIMEIIWEVIIGEIPGISAHVKKKGIDRFCSLLSNSETAISELRDNYFMRLYTMIGDSTKLALELLRLILIRMPTPPFTKKSAVVTERLKKGHVIENFFEELVKHHEVTKKKEGVNRADHKEELNVRWEFLIFLLKFSDYRLRTLDLKKLWTLFIVDAVFPEDQLVFYKVINEMVTWSRLEEWTESVHTLYEFFSTTICKETNDFRNLTQEGMEAIENMLIVCNKQLKNLEDVKKNDKQYQGYTAPSGFVDVTDFVVKTAPNEMKGVNLLWKIVLETKDEKVTLGAMQLLNKLYTKLAPNLEDFVAEISGEFVKTAMEKLYEFSQRMLKENVNESKEIVILLHVIEEMLDESERKGNYCITPLYAMFKGNPIKLFIQFTETGKPDNNFNLQLHSRVTFGQLKFLIALKLKCFPERVSVKVIVAEISISSS